MALAPPLRFTARNLTWFRRWWRLTVVSTVLSPVLYLTALGLGVGQLIDGSALPGGSYAAFLAPGLLAATAMQVAANETSWPVLGGIKWNKEYLAVLNTPLGPGDLVVGLGVFVALRITLAAAAFLVVVAPFGVLASPTAVLAVPAAVLVALAFAMPVAALAARMRNDTGFSAMFRLVILPMFLFSGTFFPISQLPPAFEAVARLTPLYHGVELTRAATLGTLEAGPAAVSIAVLVGCAAVGTVLAVWSFRDRLVQ